MRSPLLLTSVLLGTALFLPLGAAATSEGVATLVSSTGEVTYRRTTDPEGRWSAAFPELRNKLLDHVRTGRESVATLEFDIGGRVGVNSNSEIEIVSQRKVEAVDAGMVDTLIVTGGGIWARINKGQRTQLQVQTSGGVMGIKGTEFTVETDAEGNSRLTVLEGSVELTPETGDPVMVEPGDVVSFLRTGIRDRVRRPLEELRNQLRGRFAAIPTRLLDPAVRLPRFQGLDIGVEREPLARAREAMERAAEATERAADATDRAAEATDRALEATSRLQIGLAGLGRLRGGRDPEAPPRPAARERRRLDFPTGLQPYQEAIGGACPVFRWEAYEGASRYAVLVSRDDTLAELVWSARPTGTEAAYPGNGAPLPAGRYYWRLIPLGADDRPVGRASQGWFDSSGWTP